MEILGNFYLAEKNVIGKRLINCPKIHAIATGSPVIPISDLLTIAYIAIYIGTARIFGWRTVSSVKAVKRTLLV